MLQRVGRICSVSGAFRPYAGAVLTRGERARLLLRNSVLLTVSVIVGAALGFTVAELDSDGEPSAPPGAPPREAADATTKGAEATPATSPPRALKPVRVAVVAAVLHPAATPSGQRRRRGRLGVHIKVSNAGSERVVATRPSLLAARQRIPSGRRLAAISAGRTLDATVRFETKGTVTEQLRTLKRARIVVAGRSWPIAVKVGSPAHSSGRS